jgi:hypothetical protein
MTPNNSRRPSSHGEPGRTILLNRAREVWQPRTSRPLSTEDVRQIVENVSGFFQILLEWAAAEQPAGTVPMRETTERVTRRAATLAKDSLTEVICESPRQLRGCP